MASSFYNLKKQCTSHFVQKQQKQIRKKTVDNLRTEFYREAGQTLMSIDHERSFSESIDLN